MSDSQIKDYTCNQQIFSYTKYSNSDAVDKFEIINYIIIAFSLALLVFFMYKMCRLCCYAFSYSNYHIHETYKLYALCIINIFLSILVRKTQLDLIAYRKSAQYIQQIDPQTHQNVPTSKEVGFYIINDLFGIASVIFNNILTLFNAFTWLSIAKNCDYTVTDQSNLVPMQQGSIANEDDSFLKVTKNKNRKKIHLAKIYFLYCFLPALLIYGSFGTLNHHRGSDSWCVAIEASLIVSTSVPLIVFGIAFALYLKKFSDHQISFKTKAGLIYLLLSVISKSILYLIIFFKMELLHQGDSFEKIFRPYVQKHSYLIIFFTMILESLLILFNIIISIEMMNFLDSLCGCFSPQIKQNIIDYLSSAKLNNQLMEEEKCSQESSSPEQSIYAQVKTKSYYFIKLKQQEAISSEKEKQEEKDLYDNSFEPNYYPKQLNQTNDLYDELLKKKTIALQKILGEQISEEYSKIYDSQDELNLKIYCKQEIYQSRRFNSYRFSFDILHAESQKLLPKDYADLNNLELNAHQPQLTKKQLVSVTEAGLQIYHRCYKKVLVIQPHEFYTAQKCMPIQENNKEAIYNVVFSVKGSWEKQSDHNSGWVNLVGMKVSLQKQLEEQLEHGTSLRQQESHLHFEGYINVDLDITVNSNMLKQPIAKEIRTYVQKLLCSLTKSDAI